MTRTLLAATLCAAVASVSLTHTAEAQGRRRGIVEVSQDGERQGFWGSLTFVGGAQSTDVCGRAGNDWCRDRWNPGGAIALGGTVNPNVRLGAELYGLWDSRLDSGNAEQNLPGTGLQIRERLTHVFAIAQLYPSAQNGFFFRVGGGYGWNRFQRQGELASTQGGFGGTVGVGYDVRIGRNAFITPTVFYNQYYLSNGNDSPFKQRSLNVGLALGFQSGR